MLNMRLYMLQRGSALIMAPLVLIHIVVMIVAVQGGLSSSEILGRTQGSLIWAEFYGSFVVTVSIHAAIGLRVIVAESFDLGIGALNLFTWVAGLVILFLGARAVVAVTWG